MDVTKTQQKYKHYTSLCLSVMGQRRFRISMGALTTSPEGGDTSVNVLSRMKKRSIISADHSKSFVSTLSEKNAANRNPLMTTSNYSYINGMDKDEYKYMLLMESSVFNEMSNSTVHNNCQFPYYRSNKNNGRYPDAVLVKDIGISCMLPDDNIPEISIPETQKYLVKQLKREYSDLSTITNKITAYTKDIINHIVKRNSRKCQLLQNLACSKRASASQYIDNKGNLCLKLRLFNNAGTQYTSQQIATASNDNVWQQDKYFEKKHTKSQTCKDQTTICEENLRTKREKYVQTRCSVDNVKKCASHSLSCRASSIYNYLTMKKKKSTNEMLKSTFTETTDINRRRSHGDKTRLKRSSPVIFTNWKEISKSRKCKNKTFSISPNELRPTNVAKEKCLQEHNSNTIHNISDAKFHKVNIRIVKRKNKHTKPRNMISDLLKQGIVWHNIEINNNDYMISATRKDDTIEIFLTNLIEMWFEKLTDEIILDKCKTLNPLLNVDAINCKEIIIDSLNNLPKHINEASTEQIQLRIRLEGVLMKFTLNFTRGTPRDFWEIITTPLCISSAEIICQNKLLIDLIRKKDEEIAEYKNEGAELIRKNIETETFNEEQFKLDIPISKTIDYMHVFQTMANICNKLSKHKRSKMSTEPSSSTSANSNTDPTKQSGDNKNIKVSSENILARKKLNMRLKNKNKNKQTFNETINEKRKPINMVLKRVKQPKKTNFI